MKKLMLLRLPLTNKVLKYSFSLLLAACCQINGAMVQTPSTQGIEFYAGFMKNGYRTCNASPSNEILSFFVTAKRACMVTISNPRTVWNSTYHVANNGYISINIPSVQVYSTLSETVEDKGLHIFFTDMRYATLRYLTYTAENVRSQISSLKPQIT